MPRSNDLLQSSDSSQTRRPSSHTSSQSYSSTTVPVSTRNPVAPLRLSLKIPLIRDRVLKRVYGSRKISCHIVLPKEIPDDCASPGPAPLRSPPRSAAKPPSHTTFIYPTSTENTDNLRVDSWKTETQCCSRPGFISFSAVIRAGERENRWRKKSKGCPPLCHSRADTTIREATPNRLFYKLKESEGVTDTTQMCGFAESSARDTSHLRLFETADTVPTAGNTPRREEGKRENTHCRGGSDCREMGIWRQRPATAKAKVGAGGNPVFCFNERNRVSVAFPLRPAQIDTSGLPQ